MSGFLVQSYAEFIDFYAYDKRQVLILASAIRPDHPASSPHKLNYTWEKAPQRGSLTGTVRFMTPESISQIIAQAAAQESLNGRFYNRLQAKAEELHTLFRVEAAEPADALFGFVRDYVEMIPSAAHCVQACARDAGVGDLFAPFMDAATNYFAHPSVLLAGYEGYEGLLVKAYQYHRLMEEMYESNRSFRNSELLEPEATQANILVHHLIGEPFANELDQAILITVRQIAGSLDYYNLDLTPFVAQAGDENWRWMREYWTNLLTRNGIYFRFSFRSAL